MDRPAAPHSSGLDPAVMVLRWRGMEIAFGFSVFAAAALIGLLGGFRLFCQIFGACLLHEAGHLFVLRSFRRRVRSVTFCGAGVTILPEAVCGAYWQDVLILAAGPLSNLIFGTVSILCCGYSTFATMHLGLGLFNLLPYSCLDGGCILETICRWLGCRENWLRMGMSILCLCISAGLLWCIWCTAAQTRLPQIAMVLYLTAFQLLSGKQPGH